jgi:hypothetical protein
MEEDTMHDRDVEPGNSARLGEADQDASETYAVSSEVDLPIYPKGSGAGGEGAVDAAAERPASS